MMEQIVRQSALPHKMRPNAAVPVYEALCIRVSERQGRIRVLQQIMKYMQTYSLMCQII